MQPQSPAFSSVFASSFSGYKGNWLACVGNLFIFFPSINDVVSGGEFCHNHPRKCNFDVMDKELEVWGVIFFTKKEILFGLCWVFFSSIPLGLCCTAFYSLPNEVMCLSPCCNENIALFSVMKEALENSNLMITTGRAKWFPIVDCGILSSSSRPQKGTDASHRGEAAAEKCPRNWVQARFPNQDSPTKIQATNSKPVLQPPSVFRGTGLLTSRRLLFRYATIFLPQLVNGVRHFILYKIYYILDGLYQNLLR